MSEFKFIKPTLVPKEECDGCNGNCFKKEPFELNLCKDCLDYIIAEDEKGKQYE